VDDATKQEFVNLFAEIVALRTLVNEALSIALSHERNPDIAVSLARKDLSDIVERVASMPNPSSGQTNDAFQQWFVGKVRASIMLNWTRLKNGCRSYGKIE